MRSWGSRGDTSVTDEPLYGHYLASLPPSRRATHPGADDVIAAMDTDWRSVAARLTGPPPGGTGIWYQKHMAHHLTPGVGLEWLDGLTNCLLIRDPAAMIASFIKVIPDPTPEDLGLPQQVTLFEYIRERTGASPVVVDSADILRDPRGMLSRLCAAVGVPFDAAMLSWAPGRRETDGPWAPHWYTNVECSTGFQPYAESTSEVPDRLSAVLARCQGLYDRLWSRRLRPADE